MSIEPVRLKNAQGYRRQSALLVRDEEKTFLRIVEYITDVKEEAVICQDGTNSPSKGKSYDENPDRDG
jgi:hypothetical protein